VMIPAKSAPIPWTESDVLRLCTTSAVVLIGIVTSWYGGSGSASTGTQALWFNIGIAGLVIASLGNALWLLRGRGAIGLRRAKLVSLEVSQGPAVETESASASVADDTLTMPLGVVRTEGMRHLHRPDCPMVRGKTVEPADPGDGVPCGVCQP
jgi:hypothetical protein